MRNAFAQEITDLAQADRNVTLLSGDIGNRLFDNFKDNCPDQFYNCGVAEANMIGVAAGLTMSGMRAVCYTITPFITYRCMEQIRVDIGYHHVPVVIVGTGSGLSYASLGATHHSCEDMGMLRLIPGLNIVAPADAMEVRGALRAALKHDQPTYIRIGKKGELVIHNGVPDFQIGKALTVREGQKACILSTGNMLPTCLEVADRLAAEGVAPRVVSFHTVKPLDEAMLAEAFAQFDIVATVEEHSILGGLGGSVAEWVVNRGSEASKLRRFAMPDAFIHETCEQESARKLGGLDVDSIHAKLREELIA